MISFAAISPHTPLLLPAVGKENTQKISATLHAVEDLEKKLKLAEIDTLLIIASHKKLHTNAFSILLSEKYHADFKEFGDFETKLEFMPDIELIEKIRHAATDENISLTLSHEESLDYQFGVPLFFLAKFKKIKLIPFLHSYKDVKDHFEMGRIIKKVLTETNKRVGVLVSGHLSYKSGENSPLGFSKKGEEFNNKIKEALESKNTAAILTMDKESIAEAEESILLPLALLLGIIDRLNYKPQTFSFEAPLGVGYLVFNFKLL